MLTVLLDRFFDVSLFGYISFRAAMAAITAFLCALLLGRPAIEWLKTHQVREDVSKTASIDLARLSQSMGKDKTPTMGGSFLVLSLLLSVALWCRLDNLHVLLGLLLTAGLAAVGFIDDYKKLTVPHSDGLSTGAKLLGQTAITLFTVLALVWYAHASDRYSLLTVYPPFFKDLSISLAGGVLSGIGFVIFAWFVIVGTSNAANITDGMDGLSAGCMIISGLTLSVFCYVTGRFDWTEYLGLPFIPEAAEMTVVGGALCGACMGFLWYNAFPAKVFMGDSGSLPIGGLLAWMALIAKQELVLPLLGFVFFAELGSSALQRLYYQRTGGKRLFTMAPIHHGLQLKGGVFRASAAPWHEVTVVVRAWIVAAACALLSLALLKVR
ncbi:phospho-N-acetylmuramoyl-pentapeptide-transferase [Candidatus Woesearchaeota archaeon]|jgi:phospho-N-acetylmuramoyl-pentapeptide-transferase|nr:phospho-N-acetylmuramoyl-pentapeptide-transferase [Candidatus Woesearchaeota archaeon]MDP6738720.1 phospho-N-acetylmuramoyl-pentapeptide-transferase [Planctomycetota bacterium]MDP6937548.1 phospho-N-acetylmuramoyl-pentapeptide-transferase [Planctomycetota bacterium]